jgi:hypothetical protein
VKVYGNGRPTCRRSRRRRQISSAWRVLIGDRKTGFGFKWVRAPDLPEVGAEGVALAVIPLRAYAPNVRKMRTAELGVWAERSGATEAGPVRHEFLLTKFWIKNISIGSRGVLTRAPARAEELRQWT